MGIEDELCATLEEVATRLGVSLDVINSQTEQSKFIKKGPPYDPICIMMDLLQHELVSLDQLSVDQDLTQNKAIREIAKSVAAASLESDARESVFESLQEIPGIEKVLEEGDSERISDAIRMSGGLKPKKWAPLESDETIAFSISNPMTSSLFFDRIWTLDRTVPNTIGFRLNTDNERLLLGLFPGLVNRLIIPNSSAHPDDLARDLDLFFRSSEIERIAAPAFLKILSPEIAKATSQSPVLYLASSEQVGSTYSVGDYEMFVMALNNLRWIDEDKLDWEMVREIRSDNDSGIKLKRMFHWLDSSMVGKEIKFISDELELRLHDYNSVVTKHGIELAKVGFGTLLTDKVMLTLLGGSLSIASKGFQTEGLAAALGVLIAQGFKATFETVKCRKSQVDYKSTNPIAYLHEVKSTVDPNYS